MIYRKPSRNTNNLRFLAIFITITILFLFLLDREYLKRSVATIYLGSLFNEMIDQKANVYNYFNDVNLDNYQFTLSKNNYIRLQLERSKMVSNFKTFGNQWNGENVYFKSKININEKEIKGQLKLFGMNPDHFRSQNGHSFRVKYKKGGEDFGNRQFNYINPRSRDFITDYLLNLIYFKIYDGIRINSKPVEVFLNKNRFGIMLEESFFDKYLIETNSRRESVIFEIHNEKFDYNHLDNDSDSNYSGYIEDLYYKDYNKFLEKLDVKKIKALLILGMVVNDEHPFSSINLHWYYNPVSDLIEPTIRESFVNEITGKVNNLQSILNNNKIISDLYSKMGNKFNLSNISEDLYKIKEIIYGDKEYLNYKKKLSGFKNFIDKREEIILNNIEKLEKALTHKKKNERIIEKIIFKRDTVLKGKIEFGENTNVKIEQGVTVTLDGALIIFKGDLSCNGTKNHPIVFQGINKSGTIYFEGNKDISIKYTSFKELTNFNSNQIQPASITFYNSKNIIIENATFEKNLQGDDYLNFFKSKNIIVNRSLFKDVLNDAIDSDFSSMNIIKSSFINIGNDAVDGSGSEIQISYCDFNYIFDKAISAGEQSTFKISNVKISSSEIGIVSKDKSDININNSSFVKNKLDFASFIKKGFFGASRASFNNSRPSTYLIENGSGIIGLDKIIYSNKVEKKLYGNMYGRASK